MDEGMRNDKDEIEAATAALSRLRQEWIDARISWDEYLPAMAAAERAVHNAIKRTYSWR